MKFPSQLVAKEVRDLQQLEDHLDSELIGFFHDSVNSSKIDRPISLYYHQELSNHPVFKDDWGYIAYHKKTDEYVVYFTKQMLNTDKSLFKAFVAHELSHAVNRDLVVDPKDETKIAIISFLYRWMVYTAAFYFIGHILSSNNMQQNLLMYLGVLGLVMIQSYFASRKMRKKEYLADIGALQYVSKDEIIALLENYDNIYKDSKIINLYLNFFGTHPSCKKRIENIKDYELHK